MDHKKPQKTAVILPLILYKKIQQTGYCPRYDIKLYIVVRLHF